MNNVIKIGITGSIGMGKSTIGRMLKLFKIPVYDSDQEVKKLLNSNKVVIRKIKKLWPEVQSKNKLILDKTKLREIVFFREKERKRLENIIHPLIKRKKEIFIEKNIQKKIIAFDIPLLYETNQQNQYDYIFLAVCNKKAQTKRVLKRENMTERVFNKINNVQMSVSEKLRQKPIVINTNSLLYVTFFSVMIKIIYIKLINYNLKK